MNRKGQNINGLGMLVPAVILIAVAGIVAALSLEMTGDIRDDTAEDWCADSSYVWNASTDECWNSSTAPKNVETPTSSEYNATLDSMSGLAEIPSKLPTIGLAVAIVVVLGIIVGLFTMFRRP